MILGSSLRPVRYVQALGVFAVLGMLIAACGGNEATATPVKPTATPAPAATPRPTAAPAATTTPAAASTPAATSSVPRTSTPAAAPTASAATPAATATPAPTRPPATATPSGPAPKYGGTFRARVSGEWNEWDARAPSAVGNIAYVMQPVLNNLLFTLPNDLKNLQPDLAASWTLGSDGLTYSFKLRPGVKWHDGIPLTSKDIVFTFDKFLKPDAGMTAMQSRFRTIDTWGATDSSTVRIKLKQPSAAFLTNIAAPSTMMYPSHIPFTPRFWTDKPVGTGPFKYVSYQAGAVHKYTRNADYWRKDAAGRAMPYLDASELYIMVDRALGQAAFQTGRLELLGIGGSDLPADQIEVVRRQLPSAKIYLQRASFPVTMHFNSRRPPFDNQKVRQAIHAAVDRKEINAAGLNGTGYYPPSLLLPVGVGGQWAIPEDDVVKMPGFREPKAQDRTLAQQLLKEAGIDPASISATIILLNTSPYQETAAVLQSELTKIGVKATLNPRPSTDRAKELQAGNFGIETSIYAMSIDDPAEGMLQRVQTGGDQNFGKWSIPAVDGLAARQDAELDPVKRKALILELQRTVYDLAIEVPLYYAGRGITVQSYVEGFTLQRAFNQSSILRHNETWLNK